MDKQHFDHIEDRIRQAAENVSPPFREEAWQKMEALLDKELGRKRRRFIAWWPVLLLVLIIGSGIVYYINNQEEKTPSGITSGVPAIQPEREKKTDEGQLVKPGQNGVTTPGKPDISREPSGPPAGVVENRQVVPEAQQPVPPGTQPPDRQKNLPGVTTTQSGKQPPADALAGTGEKARKARVAQPLNNEAPKNNDSKNAQGKITEGQRPGERVAPKEKPSEVLPAPDSAAMNDTKKPADAKGEEAAIPPDTAGKQPVKPAGAEDKKAVEPEVAESKETPKKNDVKLSQPRSGIYVMASVAADASNIDRWSVDNGQSVFGAGIGYRFNQRFGIQTGFYAGRKLYTAGPGDYKTQPGSYWSMVDILSIDANCFIYEIPLTLRYDLLQRNRFNLYALGGVSSIIMKKETYGYHYRRSGTYHFAERTYTGNKHFLSVINMSVGYEHRIRPALYLQAEPYIKMPMAGIGEGKIKLYSAGLQLGIRYQPLKRRTFK